MSLSDFDFSLINGRSVQRILDTSRSDVMDVVAQAYLIHHGNLTVNPSSYFLRFPDKPEARIIALPAAIRGKQPFSGIKWIASYPGNIAHDMPRASAVLILNNYETGYPYTCMEASLISAARTAASAALAARMLSQEVRRCSRVAFIGTGIIARNILDYLMTDEWHFDSIVVHDLISGYGHAFITYAQEQYSLPGALAETALQAIEGSELVVLATTASEPHLLSTDTFKPKQIVLNISLRDLSPEIILNSWNIVDDIDHCLKADTSPHLAEKMVNHRNFIQGTLAQCMLKEIEPDADKPIIFSPFGLGVLDLAVGEMVHSHAAATGELIHIDDFFAERSRWT
jgi:2,3-diaminopropionate biosynthesis protein SbnB